MAIRMAGTVAYLEGDWTLSGVAENIDSAILSLDEMVLSKKKSFQINCGHIAESDISGLQVLSVWLECARLRGFRPKLTHVPKKMKRTIHEHGFSTHFAPACY